MGKATLDAATDEFVGFVVLEHLQLLSDQIEQQENIEAEERFKQAKVGDR